jgi:hypothetical protein
MRAAAHLRLAVLGPLVWAAFWVAGWPGYYQQYPTWLVALGCVAILPPSAILGFRSIDRSRPANRFGRSLWLSFWFTVPFVLLDALYCGWWLGHGVGFFGRYWYLTLYYVLPWLLWPPYGWWSAGR